MRSARPVRRLRRPHKSTASERTLHDAHIVIHDRHPHCSRRAPPCQRGLRDNPDGRADARDYSQTFSGADSACGFDITFSAAGTVNVTTYYDNAGLPVRESIHGSLAHTVSSVWHSLSSKGPAPVHIDLTASLAIDTGKEFSFHVPGAGVVWVQNGRFVFGDIGLISYTGLNSLDTTTLCAALAP